MSERLSWEDIVLVLRRDLPKYARAKELLEMKEQYNVSKRVVNADAITGQETFDDFEGDRQERE